MKNFKHLKIKNIKIADILLLLHFPGYFFEPFQLNYRHHDILSLSIAAHTPQKFSYSVIAPNKNNNSLILSSIWS